MKTVKVLLLLLFVSCTAIGFITSAIFGGMRVTKEDEIAGLDGVEHGMAAYAD